MQNGLNSLLFKPSLNDLFECIVNCLFCPVLVFDVHTLDTDSKRTIFGVVVVTWQRQEGERISVLFVKMSL